MAFNVFPSVSFDEVDLTTSVPSIDTTGAGFAGIFNWGPIGVITPINSSGDLVKRFGKPDSNNFETWFSAASFLAYSDNLYISRAGNTTNNTTGFLSAIANTGSLTGNVNFFTIPNSDFYNALYANGVQYFAGLGAQWIAKYPGYIGNSLLVSVCDSAEAFSSNINLKAVSHSNSTANSVGANATNTNIAFIVGSNQAVITLANTTSFTDATTTALGTLISTIILSNSDVIQAGNSTMGTQDLVITNISSVLTVNTAGTNTGIAQVTLSFNNAYRLAANVTATTFNRKWRYASLFNAAPGQNMFQTQHGNVAANDAINIVIVDSNGAFSGVSGQILETYQNLSRANDAFTPGGQTNYYGSVINQSSQYIWFADDRSGAVTNTSVNLVSSTNIKPYNQQMASGQNGQTETSVLNTYFTDLANAWSLFASPNSADVELLFSGKNDASGVLANYIISNICLVRRDCLLFYSPYAGAVVNNKGQEATTCQTFMAGMQGSSRATVSSGYKYMYDQYNDVYRWIPLNGDDAGLTARSGVMREAWYSPAGLNRGQYSNAIKLSWNPNPQEQAILYNANINPSLTIKGKGSFLFGDKTTAVDQTSAFSRIGVRRLFIVIEKAISTYAMFELFEFNDAFTRAQFVATVNPYLKQIKALRGITDFKVICDDSNNPPVIIDAEQFVGDIYVKPSRSINFINLNFVAVATGVDFNEVVINNNPSFVV